MKPKYLNLTPELYDYVCKNRTGVADQVLDALRAETEALGDDLAKMLIGREQGSFLTILVAAIGAKRAIEVGTFTGYSAICIARGLPANGELVCLDKEERSLTKPYWEKAGVADKIDFRRGFAAEELRRIGDGQRFDFAFIDADKTGYDAYYELLLPKMKQNALLVFDNMLHDGNIINHRNADDTALDQLNQKLANDDRVETVLLAVADGLQICRKR